MREKSESWWTTKYAEFTVESGKFLFGTKERAGRTVPAIISEQDS